MENNKVFGFIRSGVCPENVLAYKKILSSYEISVFAICINVSEKVIYDDCVLVYCLEDWLRDNWDSFDVSELNRLQEKFKEYSLWEIFYTDRYLRYKYENFDASKIIVGIFSFWEHIFNTTNVNYIISDCIIGASSFYGMILGKKREIRFLSMPTARYKKYYTYFSLDEGFENIVWENMVSKSLPLIEDEILAAKGYISEYIKCKSQPYYMKAIVNKNKDTINTIAHYIKRFWHISYLWDRQFDNKYDINIYKGRKLKYATLLEAIRKLIIPRYMNQPDFQDDYILYPLHFQPEASTCVYARKYENQLAFLELLAKSIPAGKVIYVKEHSVRQGHRPLSFYKELGKFSNIKIISPYVDTHELIKNSSFVVCLTSTVGFEALMYGKPVFVCGDTFYNNFSGVERIHDVFDEKYKFFTPPIQNRELYIRQMAYYLKSIQFCTTQEEPIHEESKDGLYKIQKKSMEEVLKFIDGLESGEYC